MKKWVRAAGSVCGILAALYGVLLLQLLITGLDEFELFGLTVKLRPWWKPLWEGVAFLVLMLWAREDVPVLFKRLYGLARRAAQRTGISLDAPGSGWLLWGALLGSALSFVFSLQFSYLLPHFGLKALCVAFGFLAGGALHKLFYLALGKSMARVRPGLAPARVSSFLYGSYAVLWAGLLSGPLSDWEAVGTDPFFSRLGLGFLIGLGLCWLGFARSGLPEPWGRIRIAARLLAAAAVLLASGLSYRNYRNAANAAPPRDRVLLITLDTTRADYLSCYGFPKETTPHLDALAREGVLFTRAYCPRGETDPSHASVLTGAYPRTHGLMTNFQAVTGKVASLAEYFRDRGYVTASITSRSHLHPALMNIPGFMEISAPSLAAQSTSAFDAFRRFANLLYRYRDRDLFVWLHFFDPHASYKPHRGFTELFTKEKKGAFVGKGVLAEGKRFSPEELRYARALYAGEVRYMDYYIGKAVELARSLRPVPERPPFILAIADHGESLGDYQDREGVHYAFGHGGVLYEASAHIPLIVSWPGRLPAGRKVEALAESVDVAPTMLDYLFGEKNFPGQGMSLREAIEGSGKSDDLAVMQRPGNAGPKLPYFHVNQFGVLKGRFKLIAPDQGPPELYDLSRDPEERENLAAELPRVVEELSRVLESWLARTPETPPLMKPRTKAEINVLKALGYVQ